MVLIFPTQLITTRLCGATQRVTCRSPSLLLAKPQLWPLLSFLLAVTPSSRAQKGFKNAFNLFFTLQQCLVPSCAPRLAACLTVWSPCCFDQRCLINSLHIFYTPSVSGEGALCALSL